MKLSVDDMALILVLAFEVRDLERLHGSDRQTQRVVGLTPALALSQLVAELAQRAQHPRPIEPLPFTVFAEVRHEASLQSGALRQQSFQDLQPDQQEHWR